MTVVQDHEASVFKRSTTLCCFTYHTQMQAYQAQKICVLKKLEDSCVYCKLFSLFFVDLQESELERLTRAREAETKFIREQNDLEITKAKEMSGIETEKFKNMVDSIGSDTIASIANAGPEMQVCVCV